MKTVLRQRNGWIPDGINESLRRWIVNLNANTAQDKQDLEEEFNKIGSVKRWTPVLTFTTPGDVSVGYTAQAGDLIRTRDEVMATFNIVTSSFTHTTASGSLNITGLPYTASTLSADSGFAWLGDMFFSGITKAGYTQIVPAIVAGDNTITLVASGSAKTVDPVMAADMPTGGSVILKGSIHFRIRS